MATNIQLGGSSSPKKQKTGFLVAGRTPWDGGLTEHTWEHHQDQFLKLVEHVNELTAAQAAAAQPTAPTPAPTPVPTPPAPIPTPAAMWAYYKGAALLENNVKQLHVLGDLDAGRTSKGNVWISYTTPTVTPPRQQLLARYGGWVTHNFSPMGAGGQTGIRCEWLMWYDAGGVGNLLQFGTAAGLANQFNIWTAHTVWTFNAYNVNEVTCPAPAAGLHVVIVEFDGTNPGNGVAQWKVWIDGVLQTLTATINGNINGVGAAIFYASGAEYQAMLTPCSLPHSGAIAIERISNAVMGSYTAEPPYENLIMWTDARVLVNSEYVENMIETVTPTGIADPAPTLGTTGNLTAWIMTARTSISAMPNQATTFHSDYSLDRTNGFPGQFQVWCDGVTTGARVQIILATPNILRAINLADKSDEQKWSLFHCPQGTDMNDTTDRYIKDYDSFIGPVALTNA